MLPLESKLECFLSSNPTYVREFQKKTYTFTNALRTGRKHGFAPVGFVVHWLATVPEGEDDTVPV